MIHHRLSALLITAAAWPACASHPDDGRPVGAEPPALVEAPPTETALADGKKVRAPVELALAASGARDALTLTLTIKATADIPRAVSRFVLPDGVVPVSGELEQELGALARGAERTASIVVRAPPSGTAIIAAGVDCHLSHGVKLYGVAHLTLDATQPAPTMPDRTLHDDAPRARGELARVRAVPARPKR